MDYRQAYGRIRPVCPACNRTHFIDPKVAVAVVIQREAEILLIQRGAEPERGKWSFPAGFVEGGEDPARAAEREGLEETGLLISTKEILEVFFRGTPTEGADILLVYRAEVVGGALQPGDDATDARYFTSATIPTLAFPSTKNIIARWRQQL